MSGGLSSCEIIRSRWTAPGGPWQATEMAVTVGRMPARPRLRLVAMRNSSLKVRSQESYFIIDHYCVRSSSCLNAPRNRYPAQPYPVLVSHQGFGSFSPRQLFPQDVPREGRDSQHRAYTKYMARFLVD